MINQLTGEYVEETLITDNHIQINNQNLQNIKIGEPHKNSYIQKNVNNNSKAPVKLAPNRYDKNGQNKTTQENNPFSIN